MKSNWEDKQRGFKTNMVGIGWGGVEGVGGEEIDREQLEAEVFGRGWGERREDTIMGGLAVPLPSFATNQHHRVLLLFLFDFSRTIHSFIPTLRFFFLWLFIHNCSFTFIIF